jgi:hypothetical protein
MAEECFILLDKNYVERSTKTIQLNEDESPEYAFLEQIITPIYNIVAAVRDFGVSCFKNLEMCPICMSSFSIWFQCVD